MVLAFPFWSPHRRGECIARWSRDMLRIVRVRLHVHGRPAHADVGRMLLSNHISWIDILAINGACTSRFVAKSDIRNWFLIGWLAHRAGTLFIARGKRREAARLGRAIRDALSNGDTVAFFPEGTTTDGSRVLSFHGSLLQAAIDCGSAVQPVALHYVRGDGSRSTEVAYDGDRTLGDTLRDMSAVPVIHAHVHFLAEVPRSDRRQVARMAEEVIRARLAEAA